MLTEYVQKYLMSITGRRITCRIAPAGLAQSVVGPSCRSAGERGWIVQFVWQIGHSQRSISLPSRSMARMLAPSGPTWNLR